MSNLAEKIDAVLHAENTSFEELVKVSGLNPATDFQNINLKNIDFSNSDLSGFNFSGSNIAGAKFINALINDTIFDNEQIKSEELKEAFEHAGEVKNESELLVQDNVIAEDEPQDEYLEMVSLIEKLRRRLLDVIKDEFERDQINDLNPNQALLLYNLGDKVLSAGELRKKGYYLGSDVSYNLKKLVDQGYISHQKSDVNKRYVRVSLTEKGSEIQKKMVKLFDKHKVNMNKISGLTNDELTIAIKTMKRLERFWTDSILYRL